MRSSIRRYFLFILRGMLVISIGYINYRQWQNGYKHHHEYFHDRKWTYIWVIVPVSIIIIYFITQFLLLKNTIITRQWKHLLASGIMGIMGCSLLAYDNDECNKVSQMRGKHFYGHLSIGIGIAIFASLDWWKPLQQYTEIIQNDIFFLF